MLLKVLMVLKVALFSTHILMEDENKALQSYNKWNSEHMQAAFDYFNSQNDKDLGNAEKKLRDEMMEFDFKTFENKSLIRYMKMMTNIGDAALSPHNLENIEGAIGGMLVSYSDFKAPMYKSNDPNEVIDSFPKIDFIMRNCRDPDELKYYWECWYNSVGRKTKENYFKYSKLRNDAAKLNGKKRLESFQDILIEFVLL